MRHFLVRLGAAVFATLIAAPVAGALLAGVPFHRVMSRTFMVCVALAFLPGAGPPRGWPGKMRGLGLSGPDRAKRFAAGFAVSVLLLAVLLTISYLTGGRRAAPSCGSEWPRHLAGALATGLIVSLIEEIACRGYLLTRLGGAASALLYAIVHYVRPLRGSAPAGDYDPLLAVRRLPEMFGAFGDLRNVTLGIGALFLFGLALNLMRRRTGTLYLGIGVHAGLVAGIDLSRRFLDPMAAGSPWIHGGPRLYDGLFGAAGLLLLWLAARRLPSFAPPSARED